MRIALVIERLDLSRGGREASTAQIAAGLVARGCDVTVLCQSGSWTCDGVTVRELGTRGVLRVERLRNFINDVQEDIQSQKYDIVHATLPVPGANVYQPRGGTIPGQRQAARRRRAVPLALVAGLADGLNLRRREMAKLEREVVADDNVLCLAVSEMVAKEFADHYDRTRGVRVIYNGVEVPDPTHEQWAHHRQRLRFTMDLGRGDAIFLTVARNFRLKAIDQAIIAFAKWYHLPYRTTDGRLVVVGRDVVEGYQRFAGLREVVVG